MSELNRKPSGEEEDNFYDEVMAAAGQGSDDLDEGYDEEESDEEEELDDVGEEDEEEEGDEEEDEEDDEDSDEEDPQVFKHPKTGEDLTLSELFDGYLRQSDYTRKTQETAALRKSLEQQMQTNQQHQMVPASQAPANPIQELQTLAKQIEDIDSKIEEAVNNDDIFEHPKLQVKRQKLERQYNAAIGRLNVAQAIANEIHRAVPNLVEKDAALSEFMAEALGEDAFTPQELAFLTNPMMTGRAALKVIKLVNTLYDRTQESKTSAQKKIKKRKPNKLKKGATNSSPSKKKKQKIQQRNLHKRAMQSGGDVDSWADYIGSITEEANG